MSSVLAIPVRGEDSRGQLRPALDMTTVLLAAGVFLSLLLGDPDLGFWSRSRRRRAAAVAGGRRVGRGFAVARLAIAGAIGMHPRVLRLLASAGVVETTYEIVEPLLRDTSWHRVTHVAPLAFRALLIAAALLHWRFTASPDDERLTPPSRRYSLLP